MNLFSGVSRQTSTTGLLDRQTSTTGLLDQMVPLRLLREDYDNEGRSVGQLTLPPISSPTEGGEGLRSTSPRSPGRYKLSRTKSSPAVSPIRFMKRADMGFIKEHSHANVFSESREHDEVGNGTLLPPSVRPSQPAPSEVAGDLGEQTVKMVDVQTSPGLPGASENTDLKLEDDVFESEQTQVDDDNSPELMINVGTSPNAEMTAAASELRTDSLLDDHSVNGEQRGAADGRGGGSIRRESGDGNEDREIIPVRSGSVAEKVERFSIMSNMGSSFEGRSSSFSSRISDRNANSPSGSPTSSGRASGARKGSDGNPPRAGVQSPMDYSGITSRHRLGSGKNTSEPHTKSTDSPKKQQNLDNAPHESDA